jgi:hypothetical protein
MTKKEIRDVYYINNNYLAVLISIYKKKKKSGFSAAF